MNYRTAKNKRRVVGREQTHYSITDSESCLQGMKRRLGTTWFGATIVQYHYLLKDNFEIGSKFIIYNVNHFLS